MWPEFKPLWHELQKAEGLLQVAGGYGLFLKQHWLIAKQSVPTVVPLRQWHDAAPRVTKDVDIVVSLDLIASKSAQALMAQALERCGFGLDPKAPKPRWQFSKQIGADRQMLVEFHAQLPDARHKNLAIDKRRRVKHKPSLGEHGIHGRQNPEAVGSDYHPFCFEIEDLSIAVPNPVSWCLMKLGALRDRWRKSQDQTRDAEYRNFHREQAMKHSRDVCRAVALMTLEERNHTRSVLEIIRPTPEYQIAAPLCAELFAAAG